MVKLVKYKVLLLINLIQDLLVIGEIIIHEPFL